MARTPITVNTHTRQSLLADPTPTAADVANGNSIPNDGVTVLRVKNTNAGSTAHTLTVNFSKTVDGQAVTAKTYSVAAGTLGWAGPFPVDLYGGTLSVNGDHVELQITPFSIQRAS